MIEDGDQPVGIGSVGGTGRPTGRRGRPCSVRQQEIDPRRIEFGEGLVGGDRLVAKVYGAQQPAEEMSAVRLRQPVQAGGHGPVASPSAGESAVPVVRFRRAIQADPHLEAKPTEKPQIGIVQADAIRLNLGVHLRSRADGGPGGVNEFGDELTPGQQWLATVHDQRHAWYPVNADVLADARRRVIRNLH